MLRRLMIANRGEIAVRVARTAREMGITTIAVYSEADRGALHTRVCDEAVEIGPAKASESYLAIPKILEAARMMKAQAIHPGYGFLSENAEFARAVAGAGMVWIGPDPDSMEAMGEKTAARRLMLAAGLAVVPGFQEPRATLDDFLAAAGKIGYPVLVKASAGGGGKGMREVGRAADLPAALEGARREALAAFGNGDVYLEKVIANPRHVEFQIFGDRKGNVVSLFERECSVQRRHQKVVEETPCVALRQPTREKMAAAAVAAARAVHYVGAGTVEFLLDPDGNFYFLEMNTRLQVEHAVTEETLGVDLVAAQFEIAAGGELPAAWRNLSPRGHALECRVCAEDPVQFLPRSGKILVYEEPKGPGVRVDSGVEAGSVVGIDYDPLLAKLIVYAPNRPAAVSRMRRALSEYVILGVTTNIALLRRVLEFPDFEEGRTDTALLGRMPGWKSRPVPPAALAAAAWMAGGRSEKRTPSNEEDTSAFDPWGSRSAWRNA